jgi:hypothetical protein
MSVLLLKIQRGADRLSRVTPDRTIEYVDRAPSLFLKGGVSHDISRSTSRGEVLPTVAFKGDAHCRQREVHRVAPNLVLEDIRQPDLDQDGFSDALNIRSVARLPFGSDVAGLETVLHSKQNRAAVRAAALPILRPMLLDGALLAAVGARDGHATHSRRAGVGTETSLVGPPLGYIKRRATAHARSRYRPVRRPPAPQRAVGELLGLACHDLERTQASRACLRDSILPTSVGAVLPSVSGARKVDRAASQAGNLRPRRAIARERAVFRASCARRSDREIATASLTGQRDAHSVHYSRNTVHDRR